MSRSDPPTAGTRRRHRAATLLGGAFLALLLLGGATLRLLLPNPLPEPSPHHPTEASSPETNHPAGASLAPPDRAIGAVGWRSAFGGGARHAPHPATPEPAAWEGRVRTNGGFDPGRVSGNAEYLGQVLRHQRIRALLRSPARDTPECLAIVALVERRGLSLGVVPDLYNALWEIRTLERRLQQPDSPAHREGMEAVGVLELEDVMSRFRRDHGVEPAPVFDELLGLGLHPKVFFGIPEVVMRPGEPLLTD